MYKSYYSPLSRLCKMFVTHFQRLTTEKLGGRLRGCLLYEIIRDARVAR